MTIAILGPGLAGDLDTVLEESGIAVTRRAEPDPAWPHWPLIIDTTDGSPAAAEPHQGPVLRLREHAARVEVGPVFNAPGGRCAACFRVGTGAREGGAREGGAGAEAGPALRSIAAGLASQQALGLLRSGPAPFALVGVIGIEASPPGVSYTLAPRSTGCAVCGRPGRQADRDSELLFGYEDTVSALPNPRTEGPPAAFLGAPPRPYYTLPRVSLPGEAGPVGSLLPRARRVRGGWSSSWFSSGHAAIHAYLLDETSGADYYLDAYERALVRVPGQRHVTPDPPELARHTLILVGDVARTRRWMGAHALRQCYLDAGVLVAAMSIGCDGGPRQVLGTKTADPRQVCDRLRLDPGEDCVAAVLQVRPSAGGRTSRARGRPRRNLDVPRALPDVLAAVRNGMCRLWGDGQALENLEFFVLTRQGGGSRLGIAGGDLAPLAVVDDHGLAARLNGPNGAVVLVAGRLAEALGEQGPTAYQDLLVRASCAAALACTEAAERGIGADIVTELPSSWLRFTAGLPQQVLAGAALTQPGTPAPSRGTAP